MSTDDTSNNPLLGKMDALIKKHRGQTAPQPEATAPQAWLPILTEIVVRGTPPSISVSQDEVSLPASEPIASSTEPPNTDQIAEQLLQELGPKLSAVMEQQVATELRKNLDETVATLLSQLDVNVRDIVRDAVAEKLKSPKTEP